MDKQSSFSWIVLALDEWVDFFGSKETSPVSRKRLKSVIG